MKFAAAAITPGRAKTCQNGTEPSAKSIQSVLFPGMPQLSAAAARCGAAAKHAQAASRMTNSLFKRPCTKVAALGRWLRSVGRRGRAPSRAAEETPQQPGALRLFVF